jgi:hypothetical protein
VANDHKDAIAGENRDPDTDGHKDADSNEIEDSDTDDHKDSGTDEIEDSVGLEIEDSAADEIEKSGTAEIADSATDDIEEPDAEEDEHESRVTHTIGHECDVNVAPRVSNDGAVTHGFDDAIATAVDVAATDEGDDSDNADISAINGNGASEFAQITFAGRSWWG